jgi:regulator of replication initiation timing
LIVIIGISFKSFSQNATESTVLLTEPIARLVVKDLVTLDGLIPQTEALRIQIQAFRDKIATLEEINKNLQLQLENRNKVILQKDAQITTYSEMSEDLKKALKRERRMKKLYKIGSTVGLAAILLNVLGK